MRPSSTSQFDGCLWEASALPLLQKVLEMLTTNPVASATGRLAVLTRNGASLAVLDDCRRALIKARLERAIDLALTSTPALTAEQRVELGHRLTSGASS